METWIVDLEKIFFIAKLGDDGMALAAKRFDSDGAKHIII